MNVQQLGIKKASAALVRAVGGGEAAALHCRYRQQKLSAVGNANLPFEFMGVDVALDLQAVARRDADWPHVTRYMARQDGFALVALPDVGTDTRSWWEHVAAISKEGGDVVAKIATAAADGNVSADDVRKLELVREFDELIRVAVEGRARVIAALQGGE